MKRVVPGRRAQTGLEPLHSGSCFRHRVAIWRHLDEIAVATRSCSPPSEALMIRFAGELGALAR
jgi:hypothetical protein